MKLMMFDLENTVIQHWTDRSLCWVDSNTKFLQECQPDDVGIFSFALWCDENIKEFTDSGMKARLESVYDIVIPDNLIIHVDEMHAATLQAAERDRSRVDGKNDEKFHAFYDWCEANQDSLSKYDEVWLVDDTVDDEIITDFDFKVVLRNPVVIQSFL